MDATLHFNLPKDSVRFRDACNAGRWRAVCVNLESYLVDEIKNTEDFDSVKGLEVALDKLIELLCYFDVQTFPEINVDPTGKE